MPDPKSSKYDSMSEGSGEKKTAAEWRAELAPPTVLLTTSKGGSERKRTVPHDEDHMHAAAIALAGWLSNEAVDRATYEKALAKVGSIKLGASSKPTASDDGTAKPKP